MNFKLKMQWGNVTVIYFNIPVGPYRRRGSYSSAFHGFAPRAVHVEFVVDKVALESVFLQIF
jgi:hypothetical protein